MILHPINHSAPSHRCSKHTVPLHFTTLITILYVYIICTSYISETSLITFCKTIKIQSCKHTVSNQVKKGCPQRTAKTYPFSRAISHVASCLNSLSLIAFKAEAQLLKIVRFWPIGSVLSENQCSGNLYFKVYVYVHELLADLVLRATRPLQLDLALSCLLLDLLQRAPPIYYKPKNV